MLRMLLITVFSVASLSSYARTCFNANAVQRDANKLARKSGALVQELKYTYGQGQLVRAAKGLKRSAKAMSDQAYYGQSCRRLQSQFFAVRSAMGQLKLQLQRAPYARHNYGVQSDFQQVKAAFRKLKRTLDQSDYRPHNPRPRPGYGNGHGGSYETSGHEDQYDVDNDTFWWE
ncbi:MAG: hypothetical protein HOE90_16195 [Bacteriovoracaceae bacterium]|jgi:hypothetical protein|nr:hypothetical protein [Bacteriovoracaceae bacterium]